MATRPFILVGAARLAAAGVRLEEAIRDWRAAWGFAPEGVHVACTAAPESAASAAGWHAWTDAGEARAWVRFEDGFDESLQAALFALEGDAWDLPARASGSLASEVTQAAKDDLVTVLLAASSAQAPTAARSLDPATPPREIARHGCGAVIARCALAGAVLHILLPHRELPRAPAKERPARGALADAGSAVDAMPVTVAVEIGAVEIDLGALQQLVPGDVLRLGTPIEGPLALVGPGEELLCHGHLGAHEGARAIDLVP